MRKILHFLIFVFIISLSSCVNDFDMNKLNKEIGTDTAFPIPVGHTRASIFDVFGMIDNDGQNPQWLADSAGNFVYLYLKSFLELPVNETDIYELSESAQNDFSVKSKTNWFSTNTSPYATGGSIDQMTMLSNFDFDFAYNDTVNGTVVQRIDAVNIVSSKINVSVDLQNITMGAYPSAYIEVQVSFPDINGGLSFPRIRLISSDNGHKEASYDISDLLVNFPPNNTKTSMKIDVYLYAQTLGAGINFNSTTSDIKVNAKMVDIDIDKAWGFFNRNGRITGDDIYAEIPSNIFGVSGLWDNKLYFHDPRITFNITSNIGVPLNFIVDSVKAVDSSTNDERWADFGGGSKITQVPLAVPNSIGEEAFTQKTFNRANGGTNKLFQIKPDKFIYGFHVEVNHDQAALDLLPPVRQHFVVRPLKMNIDVDVVLPFWFDENTVYASQDTVKLDNNLGELLKIKDTNGKIIVEIEPERVSINIDYKNHLPIQAIATAIFYDENNNELWRKADATVECPNVDAEGFVISDKISTLSIALGGNDTQNLLKTRSIVIQYRGTAKSPMANNKINVRGTDYLDAFVSLFVKGKITADLGK